VTGSLRYFSPHPLYFSSGRGAHTTDLDGHDYVDCFLCNGPLLLGHRPPAVLDAIRAHEGVGSLVVNPVLATQVAEQIQSVVPCAERVRFVNSGTEAVLTAVRCARAFTRKSKIVKFYGHYHGQDDQFLVGLGPAPRRVGSGIPDAAVSGTLLVRYGDIEALERALSADPEVAAVLLDPAMSSGGLWGSRREYLSAVRDLTRKLGVLLIFDEIITGFRLALAGAQGFYGVTPDLLTLGKALAAGEKLGAVAGLEAVMATVDPSASHATGAAFQSGTGNDGTVALAAAYGAIGAYQARGQDGGYPRLFALSARLAAGIRAAFASRGIPCHVNQLGPMLQIFLAAGEPSFERMSGLDPRPLALFYLALLSEGALLSLPTSNHIYLSFAHTEADVDFLIGCARRVLEEHDFGSALREVAGA
jgi:glutamate-1-semialdehyde 2,1-aminomutase